MNIGVWILPQRKVHTPFFELERELIAGMQNGWKIVDRILEKMKLVGAILLVAMTLLTCTDIIGRLFRHPVFGSVELMGLMGAMAMAMALPYTHASKGHIGVEIVMTRMPTNVRIVIELLTGSLALVLFCIVTWKMFEYSNKIRISGEVSMNLGLPEYLIIGVVGFGFVMFALTIVRDIAGTMGRLRKK